MSSPFNKDPYEKSLAEIAEIDEDEENKTEKMTSKSEEEEVEFLDDSLIAK